MTRCGRAEVLLVAISIVLAGCSFEHDGQIDITPSVDYTKFGGVSIVGQKIVDGIEEPPGAIDLVHLQATLFSECADQTNSEDGEFYKKFCDYIGRDSIPTHPDDYCKYQFCLQHLYRCTGFKALEVSENVGVYTTSSRTLRHTSQTTNDFYTFSFEGNREKSITTYKIPPLSGEAKTLALLAANGMFRASLMQGAAARTTFWMEGDGGNKKMCLDRHYESSNTYPSPAGGDITDVDRYVVALSESMARLTETTQKLTQNQVSVASSFRAKYASSSNGQDAMWKGKINSRTSALRLLIGDPDQKVELCGCSTELNRASQKKALKLLRVARLTATLKSESSVSTTDLAKQILCVIASMTVAPSSGVAPDQCPWTNNSDDDVDSFLSRHRISIADLQLARQYLKDEIAAMYPASLEPQEEMQQFTWMPERFYALPAMTGTQPASYYLGQTNSSLVLQGMKEEAAFEKYATVGTVQLMDFARRSVNILLRTDAQLGYPNLDDEQRRMLQNTSLLANTAIGTHRIVMKYTYGDFFELIVHGGNEADKFILLKGEKGYRCATEGNVGGKPCDYRPNTPDYEKNTYRVDDNDWSFIAAEKPKGPLDDFWRLLIPVEKKVNNLYLMEKLPLGGLRLLGIIDGDIFDSLKDGDSSYRAASEPSRVIMPVPSGSDADTKVQQITTRELGSCGSEAEQCGNLGMKRDFVPPLENELSDNSDQYENSWQYYLNRAKEAALFADGLGEQLVEAGLKMDERAENAQREVERLCGGVANLDPFADHQGCNEQSSDACDVVSSAISQNPALQACLPPELGGGMTQIPFVAAGSRPLCLYYNENTGAVCGGAHTSRCPQLRDEGDISCTLDHFFDESVPSSMRSGFKAYMVSDLLGIFRSTATADQPTVRCATEIESIRSVLEDPNFTDEGKYIELLDILNGANSGGRDQVFPQKREMSSLNGMLALEVMPLHHYAVMYGNRVLWTTFVNERTDCPCTRPWEDECTPIVCVRDDPEDALQPINEPDHNRWLNDEITYMNNRKIWGRSMRKMLISLGVLTDTVGKVNVAKWFKRHSYDYSPLYDGGGVYPGFIMRLYDADNMSESSICIHGDDFDYFNTWATEPKDPNVPFCHYRDSDDAMHRGEWPLRYTSNDVLKSGNFWRPMRLASFLTGWFAEPLVPGTGASPSSGHTETWALDSDVAPNLYVFLGDTSLWASTNALDTPQFPIFANRNLYRYGEEDPFRVDIDKDYFLDMLDFTCAVSKRTAGTLTKCNVEESNSVPIPQSKEDIGILADFLACAGNDVSILSERIVIPDLPRTLVDNFASEEFNTLYGQYSGDNLQTILEIDAALREIGDANSSVTSIIKDGALQLSNARTEIASIDTKKAIKGLMIIRRIIQMSLDICKLQKGGTGSRVTNLAPNLVLALLEAALAALDIAVLSLEEHLLNLSENQQYVSTMMLFLNKIRELDGVLVGLKDTYGRLQAALGKLKSNQQQASMWYAIGAGLDELAGRVFPVNTVMRRRMNTLRARYESAAMRARRLAFIARRAIEFKFAVNMNNMHTDMRTVDAPASWADRICDMQGFSYERLRDASPMEAVLDPYLLENDSYEHWYIGDYVRNLEAFVESYPSNYPFTDERDTAVVSVRDDLVRAMDRCELPSRNLVLYSQSIGMAHEHLDATGVVDGTSGWTLGGCATGDLLVCLDPDPATCLGVVDGCVQKPMQDTSDALCTDDFCYGLNFDSVMEDLLGGGADIPHAGERLRDAAVYRDDNGTPVIVSSRTSNWSTSGYYQQVIRDVPAGYYMLTWYSRLPDGATPVDYRVEVHETVGANPAEYRVAYTPQEQWTRHPNALTGEAQYIIQLSEAQDLILRIHPSDSDESGVQSPSHGDVLFWGIQLENIVCPAGDCSNIAPNPYESTGRTATMTGSFCADRDGDSMRKDFRRICMCPPGQNWQSTDACTSEDRICYWEYSFEILLEDIESGVKIPSNNISVWNFNYRLEAIAVNIVGNMVIQCNPQTDPASCYTNNFVPYTIQHGGAVTIRGYDREPIDFSIETNRIEHAKALADGVTLWSPISSQHSGLLTDYWKDGLKGRPLQGSYKLRIFDTGHINWEAVNDIQLVVKYRYWTPASGY